MDPSKSTCKVITLNYLIYGILYNVSDIVFCCYGILYNVSDIVSAHFIFYILCIMFFKFKFMVGSFMCRLTTLAKL